MRIITEGLLAAFLFPFCFAAAPLPLPEMAVPRTSHPPVIDGILSPGEWDRAAACTGFVKAFDGGLAKIQSTAWIAFDDQYIYVAFRNYRGEKLTLLSANGRRVDDDRIVYDPSNEIWFSPPGNPAATYQTLLNVYPAVLDVKMIPSLGYNSKAWSGRWETASKQTADGWTVEARTPIRAYGFDRIADGDTWRALFATDILADGDKFRAWAPGGAFADIARHGFLHFTDNGPAFQLLDIESIFSGKPSFSMAVNGNASVNVTARFGAALEPAPDDILLTKAARPNEHFTLSTNLRLPARFCEITAKSGAVTIYRQVFPFTIDGSVRRPPATTRASPYEQAFGLEASYAPLSKKLLVKIDRYYMPQRTTAVAGHVRLTDLRTGKTVAERPLSAFRQDYSEFPIDLRNLAVPIESEQDWRNAKAPAPPAYRLEASLTGKDGQELAAASAPVTLIAPQFSWLPNEIGISDKVIPPWTPVRLEAETVSLWNKTYTLDSAGLAAKITNANTPQLTGPMKLEAVIDGRTAPLTGSKLNPSHTTEAAVELKGQSQAGPLTIETNTRVEFDGFVWNTVTVQPTAANVERLSLLIDIPETEAPYFVTTSGGWSSYHGATPAKWDSRESSLTSMLGNFVPYIFLTDSERGFCWFADNTKGWRLDPALPTQQLRRHDGLITLRVDFINQPGPIEQPLTIQYGWMATPQKPQPKNWRGYLIGNQKYFPQSTPVFWNEADWAVSWPYYSSPYPRNYEKSRALLANSTSQGVTGCVGNIAHAIARYVDYHGRSFDSLSADWGITPGERTDGNVARSRGPNDFQLFHFDRWSKLSGLGCLYFDENYLAEDWNYLTGGAWLLPDERVQPGYSYLGLREYNKRLRYMFHDNGKPAPNLWEHTTGGQAVYSWMPDVSMEGENVEPVDLVNDYIDALPAARLRSIGMGRNLGSAPFIMCQADRHFQGEASKFLIHQFAGWVLAHDALPESIAYWPVLASELDLWMDDVRFLPYWKKGLGIDSTTSGIEVSAHVRPGHAVLWVINTNREDRVATVRLDLAKLGLDPTRPALAYDAETGVRYGLENGLLQAPIPKRMWRAVRLIQPAYLKGKMTFFADFDREVAATEAFGGRYPVGKSLPDVAPDGRKGNCAPLDAPLVFLARHHVSSESGTIAFQFRADNTTGPLLSVGDITLTLSSGKLILKTGKTVATAVIPPPSQWNEVTLTWQGREVELLYDGAKLLTATLDSPLKLPGMDRGLDIRDFRRHIEPAKITFGPLHTGRLDDLRMSL